MNCALDVVFKYARFYLFGILYTGEVLRILDHRGPLIGPLSPDGGISAGSCLSELLYFILRAGARVEELGYLLLLPPLCLWLTMSSGIPWLAGRTGRREPVSTMMSRYAIGNGVFAYWALSYCVLSVRGAVNKSDTPRGKKA